MSSGLTTRVTLTRVSSVTFPFDHLVPSFSSFTHQTALPVFLPYLRTLRSVSRESVPAVPSWCAPSSSSVKFSFRTIFRKSKFFMGGICTLAFEKQEWSIASFLVCIAVLISIIVLDINYFFLFLLLLLMYWALFLDYVYPDWDVFVYAYKYFCVILFLLRYAYFDWHILVLLFYNCGCVLTLYLNQRSGYYWYGRSQWPCGLRRGSWSVGCWDRGFESRSRHGCLSASFCVVLFCAVLSCVGRGLATG
jgi:hypothetical protein